MLISPWEAVQSGPLLKRSVLYSSLSESLPREPPSWKKMASKTLIRAGASSLMKGLSNRSLFPQNTTQNHRILLSGSLGVTPQLFPSPEKSQTSFNLNETLASQSLKDLPFDPQGLFYPCGLPYLPFFLPDGTNTHPFCIMVNCIWIYITYKFFIQTPGNEFWKMLGCLETRKKKVLRIREGRRCLCQYSEGFGKW